MSATFPASLISRTSCDLDMLAILKTRDSTRTVANRRWNKRSDLHVHVTGLERYLRRSFGDDTYGLPFLVTPIVSNMPQSHHVIRGMSISSWPCGLVVVLVWGAAKTLDRNQSWKPSEPPQNSPMMPPISGGFPLMSASMMAPFEWVDWSRNRRLEFKKPLRRAPRTA